MTPHRHRICCCSAWTLCAAALGGIALVSLGGCTVSERDRYYAQRAVYIPAQAGDGSTTIAAWPYGQAGRATATARAGTMSDVGE